MVKSKIRSNFRHGVHTHTALRKRNHTLTQTRTPNGRTHSNTKEPRSDNQKSDVDTPGYNYRDKLSSKQYRDRDRVSVM